MDDMWLMALASIGLITRVGMAVYGSGLSRSKNAASTLARHLTDFCVVTLALWAVGMAILWQHQNGWIGLDPAFLFGNGRAGRAGTFFYLLLVLQATGIVVGTVGERSHFAVTTTVSLVMAAILIPVVGHWAWFGVLAQHGFIDLGGAGVVHFGGGVCAAVAALMVGPRGAKFNRDGSSNAIPGHSVPLTVLGVLLMLVGWVPYLVAAAISGDQSPASVAVKTLVAGAAGGLMALWYGRLRYGKVDIFLMTAGLLGGLVAISAGAHVVHPGFALLIGAVAGLLVPVAAVYLDLRFRLDDPTSGVAIHAVAGAWGVIAAGLFTSPASGIPRLLVVQVLGLVGIGVVAAAFTAVLLAALRGVIGLRSTEADEYDGLDLAEHDINAYPDFQQTMIKSYHLREA